MRKSTWHTRFLGVRMQHNYGLYKVIDDVITSNPQLERFIEVGTGGGALSTVLALHAVQKDTHLLTFDTQIRGHRHKLERVFDKLGIEFVQDNCFDQRDKMKEHMGGKPTFFFCDGGNKRKECKIFSRILPAGSVIGVHDYGPGKEATPEKIREFTPGWEPLYEGLWLDTDVEIFSCFLKKPQDMYAD